MISVVQTLASDQAIDNDPQMTIDEVMEILLVTSEWSSTL